MLISDADYPGAVDKSAGRELTASSTCIFERCSSFSVHGLIHGSSLIHIIHGLIHDTSLILIIHGILFNRIVNSKARFILNPMQRKAPSIRIESSKKWFWVLSDIFDESSIKTSSFKSTICTRRDEKCQS